MVLAFIQNYLMKTLESGDVLKSIIVIYLSSQAFYTSNVVKDGMKILELRTSGVK